MLQMTPHLTSHLIELEKKALDEAYCAHLAKLFSVWMSDPRAQGDEAKVGAARARKAYQLVLEEIEKRGQTLEDV